MCNVDRHLKKKPSRKCRWWIDDEDPALNQGQWNSFSNSQINNDFFNSQDTPLGPIIRLDHLDNDHFQGKSNYPLFVFSETESVSV